MARKRTSQAEGLNCEVEEKVGESQKVEGFAE